MLPWLLALALAVLAAALGVKVLLLRRAMDELSGDLDRFLLQDTNVLLSLSTRDGRALRFAAQLERQLRLLRAQRRRYLNGDRELKEAVTNLSHDLRTPLTALFGYLELLEQQDSLTPDARRYLSLIRARAETMAQLTEELLRSSLTLSEERLDLQPVCLNAALEEAIAGFYAVLTRRGIVPRVTLPAERVVCRLDPAALSRIFSNILNNALKYSAGDLEVSLTSAGAVTFSNTAPGLDPVQVGRLFDRFFSVEAAQHSTGLGLSIARTLTERMGGAISAQYDGGKLWIVLKFFPEQ